MQGTFIPKVVFSRTSTQIKQNGPKLHYIVNYYDLNCLYYNWNNYIFLIIIENDVTGQRVSARLYFKSNIATGWINNKLHVLHYCNEIVTRELVEKAFN